MKQLPEGCGYQGYEFGASYLDSLCCGGKLYDCDSCDNDGNLYEPVEEIPCPICHPRKAIQYWAERNMHCGAKQTQAMVAAKALVKNIRSNRGIR